MHALLELTPLPLLVLHVPVTALPAHRTLIALLVRRLTSAMEAIAPHAALIVKPALQQLPAPPA